MDKNQTVGVLATTVPSVLAVLVAIGWMEQPVADALVEPVVVIAGGVGAIATAAAALYMFWRNRPVQIVLTAAEVSPQGVKVVVGPRAPADIKALAADPAIPGVVPGQV